MLNSALWSLAAGTAIAFQHPISKLVGDFAHYQPGHLKLWDSVNSFMDTESGSGHRLRFGHSIDFLGPIVNKFGWEGVPAFAIHLLQDFTTPDGIPFVPGAWAIKRILETVSTVSSRVATGLVSINFAEIVAVLAVSQALPHILRKLPELRARPHLKKADEAIARGDHRSAIAHFKEAREQHNSPHILIALGQTYATRASDRLRAHRSFEDAVRLLDSKPETTVAYAEARLAREAWPA